ncbi:MAG TPA: penicillin-binding transpeptidase domain-containing protein, partial [Bacilli bacterium]
MNKAGSMTDPEKIEMIRKRHFAFRLNVFFFCVFFVFSILIVRLAILQFVEGAELSKKENSNSESTTAIPPIRGNIYDKNGYEIAISDSTQSLFYRYDTNRKKDEVILLANKLSEITLRHSGFGKKKLTPAEVLKAMDVGYDLNKLATRMTNYSFSPRRIKVDLSKEEIAYILEHRDELQGIDIVEESIRKYSKETIAPQLVGYLRSYDVATRGLDYYQNIATSNDLNLNYLTSENVGYDGIELLYQKELRGQNGTKSYSVNAKQQITSQVSITPPTKGNNLYLTIDKDVQLITEKAIMDQLAYMKTEEARILKYPALGAKATTGYAVAIEVKTGKVIAMASMPDYDPNVWSGGGISSENWGLIQPFYQNGAIREVFPNYPDDKERRRHPSSLVPLGSTMKPLTVLVGLNEKLITANEIYPDRGLFTFGRKGYERPIRNSDDHAYGNLNAMHAIRVSSNTYMAEMVGNRLYKNKKNPVDIWDSYMKKFGLGIKTGSGLPLESAGTIEYFNEEKNASAQSAMVFASFGQQGRYTALQLAQYVA